MDVHYPWEVDFFISTRTSRSAWKCRLQNVDLRTIPHPTLSSCVDIPFESLFFLLEAACFTLISSSCIWMTWMQLGKIKLSTLAWCCYETLTIFTCLISLRPWCIRWQLSILRAILSMPWVRLCFQGMRVFDDLLMNPMVQWFSDLKIMREFVLSVANLSNLVVI